jgi:hypothetical protein
MLTHHDLTDRQAAIPVAYRSADRSGCDCGNQGCRTALPEHEAQLLTYLRMSGSQVGLLLNFSALRLKDGLRRLVRSRQGDEAAQQ